MFVDVLGAIVIDGSRTVEQLNHLGSAQVATLGLNVGDLCDISLLVVVVYVAALKREHLDDGDELLHNIHGGEELVVLNQRDKVRQTCHNLKFLYFRILFLGTGFIFMSFIHIVAYFCTSLLGILAWVFKHRCTPRE